MAKFDGRKGSSYGARRERRDTNQEGERRTGERRPYQSRGPSWTRKPEGERPEGSGRRFDGEGRRPYAERSNSEQTRRPREDGERRFELRGDGERRFERRGDGERRFERRDDGERRYGRRDDGERRFERRGDGERRFERRDEGERRYGRREEGERRFERRDGGFGRPSYPSSRPYAERHERRNDGEHRFKYHDDEINSPRQEKRRVALKDRDVHRVKDSGSSGSPYQENYPEVELREDRLEGRNPILEAIKAGRTIDKLWVLRSADGKIEAPLMQIVYAVRDAGGVVVELEKSGMDKMSQTHAHQGVIAQTAMHDYYEIEDLLAFAKEKGEKPFLVLLDEIQDAYNLGSILRIADAAGVHGVVFPKRRAIGLDAVVAKASAGAIEHVKCCRVNNLVQTIETLKKEGLWIVGTGMGGDVFYQGERLNDAIALVIGSEGEGMRPLVEKYCDYKLSIPMLGQVNSLNAAVAAGIIIFEAVRQREAAGVVKTAVETQSQLHDTEVETLEEFEQAMNTSFETEVDASEALETLSSMMDEVIKRTDLQGDAEG